MIDPRPDFETETFTPFELYEKNNCEFGFLMKSWGQPFYGGTVVEVLGWLHWGYYPGGREICFGLEPGFRFDKLKNESVQIDSFVCKRTSSANMELMVIENIFGKGWLPEPGLKAR